MTRTALAAAISGMLLTSPALAVDLQRSTETYLVAGTTARLLREHMDRQGPVDPQTGQHWDAYTRWKLDWNFNSRSAFNGCEIARVWTRVQVVQTFPRLADEAGMSESLRAEWARYMNALKHHEEGHVDIPTRAAERIESTLGHLRRDSCERLENDANTEARAILQEARQQELAYDVQTDHGRGQGARFPWTEGDASQLTDAERLKLKDRVPAPR